MTGRDPLLDPPPWAPSWLPTVDDVRGMRAWRWIVGAVFVAGLAGCVSEGADRPADPVLGAPTTDATTSSTVPGAPPASSAPPAAGATLAERFGDRLEDGR